jgi:very-short-patch-repair endonuclease
MRRERNPLPINEKFNSWRYRGFDPGIRKEGDERYRHGPVKIIYSRDACPVVDPPTRIGFRAGELRREAPKCELIIREALKRFEKHGFHFQHSVAMFERYIADFLCPEAKLLVELDGFQHTKTREKDRQRDKFFRSHGYATMRFFSDRVYTDLEGIMFAIATFLKVPYEATEKPKA